jgi:TPR repeat protein
MMNLLGQCGQRQDFGSGLDMLRYSADNADENAPQGAYVYGMLHVRELPEVSVPDHFLPMDVDTARLNIEKAAYLGFGKAQVKMGSAYELCELNCHFDPALSLHYSNLAARQGEPEAEMAISKWFLSGYEGVFNKDEGMAFAYAQRAAAEGLPTAEFAMGYFHEVGIHVPASLKEARVWYGKAADHGNKDALGRIEGISRSKTLSRKDHEKVALHKIKSTRRRGESTAQAVIPQGTVSMPQFPSTQDNYTDGYGHPPQQLGEYGQTAGAGYGPGYGNYPPAAQRPGNDFRGYPQNGPPTAASSTAGYPASQGGYPQQGPGGHPPGPGQMSRPPSNMAPQASAGPYNGGYSSPAPGSMPPQGPAGYGRPGPSPAPPQHSPHVGQGSYGPSTPQPQGYRTSSGPVPQSAPPGRKPLPSPGPGQSHSSTSLGFVAPPDLSGADRRKESRRQDNQPTGPQGRGGYGMPSGPGAGRPPASQPPSSSSTPRPPRGESLQQRPPMQGVGPSSSSQPSRPTPPLTGPGPAKAPAAKPPAQAASAPSRRPGKGPSTFEEMGVPQSKKQEDCVSIAPQVSGPVTYTI